MQNLNSYDQFSSDLLQGLENVTGKMKKSIVKNCKKIV